jgi:hypothetical protein
MSKIILVTNTLPFLNTASFRCSQMQRATSAHTESNAFLLALGTCFRRWSHHSGNTSSGPGAKSCQPYLLRYVNQTRRLKTQENKRWSMVSGRWMQRAQLQSLRIPCLWNISVVQHRFWIVSHMKNWNSLGALIFYASFAPSTPTSPWNIAR